LRLKPSHTHRLYSADMGQLDSLPRELLYLILEHCTFEDCKSLRTTCKYISGLTSARIFQTYRIAFFQSHLERFVELSTRPDIAQCIKRLIFVGDVLPDIPSIATYEDLIDMREPWSMFSKRYIEVKPSNYWFENGTRD
jgi:hypothetical protein